MRLNLKAPISTIVAISAGIAVLLGYFLPIASLLQIRALLLGWVMLLAGVALLLGVANLFSVHLGKIRQGSSNAPYSFILLIALFITFAVTLLQGPEGGLAQWVFTNIQLPIETSLMALLAVILAYASASLLQRRTNVFSLLFFGFLLLILLGSGPIFGVEIPLVSDTVRPWVAQVLAGAGARGILIGVGLGAITTGLRILMGVDRPYGA